MVGSPSPVEINCQICEENQEIGPSHCFSVSAIRKSRDGGCWLCSTVLDAVDIIRPGWTSDHLTDRRICYNRWDGSDGCDLWFNLYAQDEWIDRFFLYQHQGMPFCPLTSLACIKQRK